MNNDLISRSALLKDLKEQHDYIMEDPEVGKTMKWCEAVCFHRTVETVESAPTVDAEKVFEATGLVKEAFDMAKSSLVPVVRCKDCKHSFKGSPHGLMCECPVGGQNTSLLGDDDFCSCGERRG